MAKRAGGHYHDPLGSYDYCDDARCPRTIRALGISAAQGRELDELADGIVRLALAVHGPGPEGARAAMAMAAGLIEQTWINNGNYHAEVAAEAAADPI